jgi:hypothetical protein
MTRIATLTGCLFALLTAACGSHQDTSGGDVVVAFLESTSNCGTTSGMAFDDHDPPMRIVFCPVTCALASECSGGIEMLFGCTGDPK